MTNETLHDLTRNELLALQEAAKNYKQAVENLQSTCTHETVLRHQTEWYTTHRVCERCGYNERAEWHDSSRLYEDKNLYKRAYDVDWTSFHRACPENVDWFIRLVRLFPEA